MTEPASTDTEYQASQLADFLARHDNVLALTGAGVSTASGIPDYRDRDGVRRGRDPIQGPEFRKSDAVRRRYWARSMVGWPTLANARSNAGHRAIAHLEARGKLSAVITQNVDGLHQQAGSERVLELHGNIHYVRCLECRSRFTRAFIQTLLQECNPHMQGAHAAPAPDGDAHLEPAALEYFRVPKCIYCAGVLKPDVVFFGDGVAPDRTEQAFADLDRADALLVIGSSLMVYSGFRFCRAAAEAGKPIALVNLGKTRADGLIGLKIAESAERVLPSVCTQLDQSLRQHL
ncbi:MAG: NAD-dependent protein deacetylase [Massilia sp.]